MKLKEKIKIFLFKRKWKKEKRKECFTWVHRYLRLHSELLADSIYQEMYDYHRNTLIAYHNKEMKNNKNINWGEAIDVLADMFNRRSPERVNEYKTLVEELYRFWKKNPNKINKIRI